MPSENSSGPAQPLENPVKNRLLKGLPVVGITLCVNSVEIAAFAAGLGYDFLWIEMEHSPITLENLRHMVLATRSLKAVPFARPPVNELWTAKRVLDAGVLGVMFPFTSTPALARQAVQACRYPPLGKRGSGATLAQMRWPEAANYYDFADHNILVITVVEDVEGLEHIDQIAATPGLDVVFIGTSDLSFSLGLRGQQDHPKLNAAINKIVAAAQKHGKFLGCPAWNPELLRQRREQGFLFFQTPTELELLAAGARQWVSSENHPPQGAL
jgi:2-keto-3-deoxy-L-rhamnonate aldolase RhmA